MLHIYEYRSFLSELCKTLKSEKKKNQLFSQYLDFIEQPDFDVNQIFTLNKKELHFANIILKSKNEDIIHHFFEHYKEKINLINPSSYLNLLIGLAHLEQTDTFKYFYSQREKYCFEEDSQIIGKAFIMLDTNVTYFGYPDYSKSGKSYLVDHEKYFFQCLFRESLLNKNKDLCLFLLQNPYQQLKIYFSQTENLKIKEWFFDNDILSYLDKLIFNKIKAFEGDKKFSYFQKITESKHYFYDYQITDLITLKQENYSLKNLAEQIDFINNIFKDNDLVLRFIDRNILNRSYNVNPTNNWNQKDFQFLLEKIKPFFKHSDDLTLFICPAYREKSINIWAESLFKQNDKLYKELILNIKNSDSAIEQLLKRCPVIDSRVMPEAIENFYSISEIYPDRFSPKEFGLDIYKICTKLTSNNKVITPENNIFNLYSNKDYQKLHTNFTSVFVEIYGSENTGIYYFYEQIKKHSPYLFNDLFIKQAVLNKDDDHLSILKEILMIKALVNETTPKLNSELQKNINFFIDHADKININVTEYINGVLPEFCAIFQSSPMGENNKVLASQINIAHERIVLAFSKFDIEPKKKFSRI